MTFVRKDFKYIYESGAKELTEIESRAIKEAEDKKNQHGREQKQAAQQSLEHLEKKSELLQVELKQSINESLKKLQDTLAVENAQSEAFLSSLMTELKTLTKQMKVKLSALKQSHHENVTFAKAVAAEHYLTNSEEMSFALEHALSNAIQDMGAKAKGNFQGLQLNLEQALAEVQNTVSEVTKSNLTSFKDDVDTVPAHSSYLLKTFFIDSQRKLSQLEASARQANSEVESSAVSLLENVTNHANLIETKINTTYEELTTAHFQKADNRLSKFADELSILHDTTTEKLITVTDQLSNDLVGRSRQVQDGLHGRCDDVVNRVDNLFSSFQTKLNDRLQFSQEQKQALESDKNRILVAVQNEMLSIQQTFGKKIAGMLDQSKAELIDVTKSVEAQMLGATESLGGKMSDSADIIQKQIETEVTKFLQEITTVRSAAIDEISNAAKGNVSSYKNINVDSNIEDQEQSQQTSALDQKTVPSISSSVQEDSVSSKKTQLDEADENEEWSLSEHKTRRNRKRKDNQE